MYFFYQIPGKPTSKRPTLLRFLATDVHLNKKEFFIVQILYIQPHFVFEGSLYYLATLPQKYKTILEIYLTMNLEVYILLLKDKTRKRNSSY